MKKEIPVELKKFDGSICDGYIESIQSFCDPRLQKKLRNSVAGARISQGPFEIELTEIDPNTGEYYFYIEPAKE